MRKIAIALSKGGVGKTTTAIQVAAGLAERGRRVLLVDTDTQGQCSRALGLDGTVGLADLMNGSAEPHEVLQSARTDFFLLPNGADLAGVGRTIARREFNPQDMLKETLEPFEDRFDYVLVDTSPAWDSFMVNVLFYTNEIISPVLTEGLAVYGLVQFAKRVQELQKHHQTSIRYVVPTMVDKRVKQSSEFMAQLESAFPGQLCEPIRVNVRLSEASTHGETIWEYAPASKGANDYKSLISRIIADE